MKNLKIVYKIFITDKSFQYLTNAGFNVIIGIWQELEINKTQAGILKSMGTRVL